MKKIKYVIVFFLFIFTFLLGSELYQNHLDSFTNDLYFFYSECDMENRYSDMLRLAKENDCEVFCFDKKNESMLSTTITVYASNEISPQIKQICKIAPGEYKSLFSGSTKVEFKDFLSNPSTDTTFYFFGTKDNVETINETYRRTYNGGAVHKNQLESGQWLYPVLLSIFAILLLLLTWFDIQFQKKENFILVSLGKSNWSIILKNIIMDSIYICGIYLGLYLFLHNHIYVKYLLKETLLAFAATLLLNALLYFSMLGYDLKKALSTSNFSAAALSNCYVVKAVTLIITVVVLSSNVLLIGQNGNILMQYSKINAFDGYQFLDIYSTANYDDDSLQGEIIAGTVGKQIFYDYYKDNKVAFSVVGMGDSNTEYLLIDKKATNLIESITDSIDIDWEKDFSILIPKAYQDQKKSIEKNAKSTFKIYFEEIYSETNHESIFYNGTHNVVYFKNEKYNLQSGFETIVNPVIVFCHFSEDSVNKVLQSNVIDDESLEFKNFMFKVSDEDIPSLEEKYLFREKNLEVVSTGVVEKADYVKAAIERIILLNAIISLFMLLLEFMITTTTVKLEYTTNAMTVSVMKILGYSIFSRNKAVFILNGFAAFIAVFTTIVSSVMARLSVWRIALIISIVFILIESVIIYYYVRKLDKTNVSKILKGGSL